MRLRGLVGLVTSDMQYAYRGTKEINFDMLESMDTIQMASSMLVEKKFNSFQKHLKIRFRYLSCKIPDIHYIRRRIEANSTNKQTNYPFHLL